MPKVSAERAAMDGPALTFLADCLARDYGIGSADFAFLGGEWDRNYRLTTADAQTYLVKVHFPVRDDDELHWQDAILMHVEDKDLEVTVPRIARTLDGAARVPFQAGDDHGLIRVLHWVPGTELSRVEEHSTALLGDIGVTAAAITAALVGFQAPGFPQTHHWDLLRSGEVIRDALHAHPALAEDVDAKTVLGRLGEVEPTLTKLPRAVVHHDLNDNNVLVGTRQGRQAVSGVLDFNDALFSVRVAEPAIAGAYAMLRKDAPLAALGHVVAGYHGAVRLTDEEIDAIFPLATARLCVQALTWTIRARTHPSDYGAMRMRHTAPTLRRLLEIEPERAAAYLRTVCAEPDVLGRRPGSDE